MQIILFILAITLLIGLVVVHEWGHYIVAKRSGVDSEEFGIGLPPRAWSRKLKSGLLLSINWLPLGGYVKMKGESDGDTTPGSFGAASVWAKTKILLAGVAMNFVTAVVLLTILGWVGMPVLLTKDSSNTEQFSIKSDTKIISQKVTFGSIIAGSPADKAGLRSDDVIEIISNGASTKQIKTAEQLHNATQAFAGQVVEITYLRQNQELKKQVQLLSENEVLASRLSDNPKGHLGVSNSYETTLQRSTWSAPINAMGLSLQLSKLTLQGLWSAFSGLGSTIAGGLTGNHSARENGQTQASSQVGGPVAVVHTFWDSGSLGFNFMVALIAAISITLAVVNILPIPALDGGRLTIILLARLLVKRAFTKETEAKIVGYGWLMILALIVLVTIVDVNRYF